MNNQLKAVQGNLIQAKDLLFAKDIWKVQDIGFSLEEIELTNIVSLSFTVINIPWLKNIAKESVWRKRSSVTAHTLQRYLVAIRSLCRFINASTYAIC